MGDIPSALLYYEKAHKLAPGEEDIKFNIQWANAKIKDKVVETPTFFFIRLVAFLSGKLFYYNRFYFEHYLHSHWLCFTYPLSLQ